MAFSGKAASSIALPILMWTSMLLQIGDDFESDIHKQDPYLEGRMLGFDCTQ
jgi:hypothetical protein